ncbi:hypothetical protein [Tenggerimyces flavus]|uniref:FAD assembly factor SdhE n=1 Tax=Tenggerimyces flavus TaxID=1708749 RepID=A0ABV7YN34_9ACTN|nr:hypothetical protein [Tenggerimyces flavus]MBM7784820.1 hypothetical protein [Tenggerimyces flavus]
MALREYRDPFVRRYVMLGRRMGIMGVLFERFDARGFEVPSEIRARIFATWDLEQLTDWIGRAAVAKTIDEVFETAQK